MGKEYLGPPIFNYTAEQWARIAAELPERGCLEEIRVSFEGHIFGHRLGEFFARQGRDNGENYGLPGIEDHENLAKAARAFITAYLPSLVVPRRHPWHWKKGEREREKRRRQQLIEEISKLAELQEGQARARALALGEMGPRRGGGRRGRKAPFYRNQLLYFFVATWAHLGGQVGSSVKPVPGRAEKSKADGPLVRFLMSAANPALPQEQPLTAGAARGFIRKIQARKSEDGWSDWDFSTATSFDDDDANMA